MALCGPTCPVNARRADEPRNGAGACAIIPALFSRHTMNKTPLNVVVLAAGKGTRMHSSLPKVLHVLGGRPMLGHALERAAALRSDRTIVIYGFGGDAVPSAFHAAGVDFVRQEPQLGTGHAVQQALPYLQSGGTTLVLYGDVPLTRATTLEALGTCICPAFCRCTGSSFSASAAASARRCGRCSPDP